MLGPMIMARNGKRHPRPHQDALDLGGAGRCPASDTCPQGRCRASAHCPDDSYALAIHRRCRRDLELDGGLRRWKTPRLIQSEAMQGGRTFYRKVQKLYNSKDGMLIKSQPYKDDD